MRFLAFQSRCLQPPLDEHTAAASAVPVSLSLEKTAFLDELQPFRVVCIKMLGYNKFFSAGITQANNQLELRYLHA